MVKDEGGAPPSPSLPRLTSRQGADISDIMKRLLLILAVMTVFVSCGKEPDNGPVEKTYVLNEVVESSALPTDDGSYNIAVTLKGQGFYLKLSVKGEEASLPEGTYQAASDISAPGGCKIGLNDGMNDRPIASGEVTIACNDDAYTINARIKSNNIPYIFVYNGPISFDSSLEPSGNVVFITEGNVTVTNSNWQETVVSGVSKYILEVLDPSENLLASIELIGQNGKTLKDLAGEYTIASNSTAAGTIAAGYSSWGYTGGSFYVDESGAQQYMTNGKVTVSYAKDSEGTVFCSIKGKNLSTVNAAGTVGSGNLELKNVVQEYYNGTVVRNRSIYSTCMKMNMKYSIYLPGDYDEGESFPILYLLHGYGDENNAWIDKGKLMKTADSYEKNGGRQMIVVCPDGLISFYVGDFEKYMYEELMPHIESTYKFNGKRAVAGLSMGGYGTLYYWSKYPEMYSYAYAMSPAVDVSGTEQILADKDKEILPALTIETGIQDTTTPLSGINPFHEYLVSEGIEHEFITRDGIHDWKFWQECLPKVLNKCGEAFE